jgi:hypothetical protein
MGFRVLYVAGFCGGLIIGVAPAFGGNSFVLGDGTNRAPAMVLHCVGANGTAVPCGVPSMPLSVMAPAGAATATNQNAEIAAQQSLVQVLGTQADPVYASGAGSVVSLLKGILQSWSGSTGTAGGTLTSRSVNIAAQQSVQLFPANPSRHYLAFQAPAGSFIWVNLAGGAAVPNGLDCAYFTAGSLYESGSFVNRGAIFIYSPIAAPISAWEN